MDKMVNLIPQFEKLITSCGTILIAVKKWLVESTNKKINEFELSSIKTDLVMYHLSQIIKNSNQKRRLFK